MNTHSVGTGTGRNFLWQDQTPVGKPGKPFPIDGKRTFRPWGSTGILSPKIIKLATRLMGRHAKKHERELAVEAYWGNHGLPRGIRQTIFNGVFRYDFLENDNPVLQLLRILRGGIWHYNSFVEARYESLVVKFAQDLPISLFTRDAIAVTI